MAYTVLLTNGTEIKARPVAGSVAQFGLSAVAEAAKSTRAYKAARDADDAIIRGIYVRGELVTQF